MSARALDDDDDDDGGKEGGKEGARWGNLGAFIIPSAAQITFASTLYVTRFLRAMTGGGGGSGETPFRFACAHDNSGLWPVP